MMTELEAALKTLYVHNLNDQISVEKLRENLYVLFSTYGKVLEINTSPSLRGQAFVVFAHPDESKRAIRDTNQRVIFGKPLNVVWARTETRKLQY